MLRPCLRSHWSTGTRYWITVFLQQYSKNLSCIYFIVMETCLNTEQSGFMWILSCSMTIGWWNPRQLFVSAKQSLIILSAESSWTCWSTVKQKDFTFDSLTEKGSFWKNVAMGWSCWFCCVTWFHYECFLCVFILGWWLWIHRQSLDCEEWIFLCACSLGRRAGY